MRRALLTLALLILLPLTVAAFWAGQAALTPTGLTQNVTTHMGNAQRTGWYNNEVILNTTNVASAKFGVTATNTALDARIDAQPVIVQNVNIGGSIHDVAYVVTQNNTVYAIDATTAAVITSVSLGTAVPNADLTHGGCFTDNATVGITSTPVINLSAGVLYVIAYVRISGANAYQLHALSLTTLADTITPQTISGSITLNDNSTVYNFSPLTSRQRPALLLANGNVYAGFGSFCEYETRGWVLGWNATTLAPITSHQIQLANSLATDPVGNSFYLTSVWMSGAGLAADAAGNVYAVTGNSDSAGSPGTGTTSFDPPYNIQESMIKLDSGVSTLLDYFSDPDLITLDVNDKDLGSGGVMLLPDQSGPVPHLAIAAGKLGTYYLVNRDNMGHWSNGGTPSVVATVTGAACWCVTTYFVGTDGTPRVVIGSAGANSASIYPFNSTTDTFGTPVVTATMTQSSQGRGLFCVVSSNGIKSGSEILWCLDPYSSSNAPTLYAFDAMLGTTLYSGTAGQWTNTAGLENNIPTVSNGKVYVATDKQFYIFGLSP